MSTIENTSVVRTFVDALNDRDYDRFRAVFAPDATITFSGSTLPCHPGAARDLAAGWDAVFPDWRIDLIDLVAQDDKVAARMPWTGTHHGQFLDLAPTGLTVAVDEMILFRLSDGLIVEAWEVWDEATMRRQLTGADPA